MFLGFDISTSTLVHPVEPRFMKVWHEASFMACKQLLCRFALQVSVSLCSMHELLLLLTYQDPCAVASRRRAEGTLAACRVVVASSTPCLVVCCRVQVWRIEPGAFEITQVLPVHRPSHWVK